MNMDMEMYNWYWNWNCVGQLKPLTSAVADVRLFLQLAESAFSVALYDLTWDVV